MDDGPLVGSAAKHRYWIGLEVVIYGLGAAAMECDDGHRGGGNFLYASVDWTQGLEERRSDESNECVSLADAGRQNHGNKVGWTLSLAAMPTCTRAAFEFIHTEHCAICSMKSFVEARGVHICVAPIT